MNMTKNTTKITSQWSLVRYQIGNNNFEKTRNDHSNIAEELQQSRQSSRSSAQHSEVYWLGMEICKQT